MLGLLCALLIGGASAEVMLRPSFMYMTDSIDGGGGPTTTTRTLIDVAAGYKSPKMWTITGVYDSDAKNVSSSGATSKYNRTSLGLGAGYLFKNGFFLDAAYFIQSKYSIDETKYDGSGYQADLGYRFDLTKLSVGFMFVYRAFSYDKVDGQKLETPLKTTYLDPMLTFFFFF